MLQIQRFRLDLRHPHTKACTPHNTSRQLTLLTMYGRAFGQYLVDMEWLTLTLEDHFNGMLGEAAVKVTGLGETTPFAGCVTFVQARS